MIRELGGWDGREGRGGEEGSKDGKEGYYIADIIHCIISIIYYISYSVIGTA